MTGLRPPPRAEAPSRVVARFVGLIVLLILAGSAIWAVVTNQRIDLIEVTSTIDLDRTAFTTTDGTALAYVQEGSGAVPVVLLHDFDVAGGVLWDGVVAALGDRVTALRIDLPGFGLSDRVPQEGSDHTVAVMAEMVTELVADRFDGPVVFAGVGLGGKVAAEIAVIHPEIVTGLVMIDVDFDRSTGWVEFLERLPFYGRPVTFSFEGGGAFSAGRWAPNCESDGWCPTQDQAARRDTAETIENTSESLRAHRRTPAASLVPSKLNEIAAPTYYLWSQEGEVPRDSVDEILEAMPSMQVEVVSAWKAHLEAPEAVANAILTIGA